MGIRIVPHNEELRAAAEEFNQRMRAGGSQWGVYVNPEPDWIPKRPNQNVWREHYVAVDEHHAIHGGFVLKPQQWQIRGKTSVVTDWQGPVSEGSVNPKHAALAIRLIREMVGRRPALFSWGHGGNEQPVVQILRRMNWLIHETPFCLLVLKPSRFLRLNAYLRGSTASRACLDFLAFSGVGFIGLRVLHALLRVKARKGFHSTALEFAEFGQWANDLWNSCRGFYKAVAVRDAATMNVLAPSGGWPPVKRLRVERSAKTIGWALVMDTQMHGDVRFGELRVGSIVDCFADPIDAGEVVSAATAYLRRSDVDIVVSNQSDPRWVRGFAENGYLVLPRRRLFVASPELRRILEPFEETAQELHLTNMDGHGPHAL